MIKIADEVLGLYHACIRFYEGYTKFIYKIRSGLCPPYERDIYMDIEREQLQDSYFKLVDSVKKCEEDRKGEVKFD